MGKSKNINVKEWGIGTLSLIISIFSVMFSFTYLGEKNIGQSILDAIGVTVPVSIISIVLFFISIYLGHKYNDNYGAKSGKILSITFIILMIILSITSSLSS